MSRNVPFRMTPTDMIPYYKDDNGEWVELKEHQIGTIMAQAILVKIMLHEGEQLDPCDACYKLTRYYIFPYGSVEPYENCCRDCYNIAIPGSRRVEKEDGQSGAEIEKALLEAEGVFLEASAEKWEEYKRQERKMPQSRINKAMAMLKGYERAQHYD